MSETEEDEILESGEDLMKADGEKNLHNPKRKKSSGGEERRRNSPRLENDDENTMVDLSSRPLDMTIPTLPKLLPKPIGIGSDGEDEEEVRELVSEATETEKSLEVGSSVKTAEILKEKPQAEGNSVVNQQQADGAAENKNEEDSGSEFSAGDDAVGDAMIQDFIKGRNKF